MIKRILIAAAMTSLAAATAAQAADAGHGKTLYLQCAACHGMQGQGGAAGPALKGIVGKKAGAASFLYTPAMKGSGLTWTEANLAAFVTAPQAKVKGTRMIFSGLKKPGDADDVVAYLKTLK